MAKTKISEFSATAANNTDIDGINIAENCPPSGINDAIRELMSQLKDWQAGTSNDPYVIGSSGSLTLNQGTANGVLYLNGSKVATSGSALTFDGTNLGIGGTGAVPLDVYANSSALNLRLRGRSADSIGQMEFWNNAGSTRYGYISSESTAITLAGISTVPLVFVTNGSEGMRLTSTGLGIGTSTVSPAGYGLHIKGSTNQVAIKLQNPQARTYQILSNGSTGGGGAANGNFTIYDDTASADRIILDASGNLGLGVTPSAWNSAFKAMQLGNGAVFTGQNNTLDANLSSNWYYKSGAADAYIANGYATLYQQTTGKHIWLNAASGTAGNAITFTQAMTLDASGNLLVGTTSQLQSSRFSVLGTGNIGDFRTSSASGYPVVCENTASGSTNMVIFLTGASTTTVGSITYNGSLTLYNTTSDQRLKENIQDAESASSLIDSLQVRKFDWKESGVHQRYGFVAQELVNIVPEAVNQPEDTEEMMAVDYSKLVPMLVKEIQSLRKRLADAGIA